MADAHCVKSFSDASAVCSAKQVYVVGLQSKGQPFQFAFLGKTFTNQLCTFKASEITTPLKFTLSQELFNELFWKWWPSASSVI